MSLKELSKKDIDKFWDSVVKNESNNCWDWRGIKDRNNRGIMFAVNKKNIVYSAAHISLFLNRNIDVSGTPIRRLCENMWCCKPDHLVIKKKDLSIPLDIVLTKKRLRNFWARVKIKDKDECWEWQGCKDKKGYGQINLNYKTYRTHRLSYMIKHNLSYISGGMCVLHKCDNPVCVNPDHLWLGTNFDNVQDRHAKGRSSASKGESSHFHKLNEKTVRKIRQDYKTGNFTTRKLAVKYNTSKSNIGHIVHNKTWRDISIE